jgi:hypothetical protein
MRIHAQHLRSVANRISGRALELPTLARSINRLADRNKTNAGRFAYVACVGAIGCALRAGFAPSSLQQADWLYRVIGIAANQSAGSGRRSRPEPFLRHLYRSAR